MPKPFASCCQPLLDGEIASTPEALMRSRYTAFTRMDMEYVQTTTDPQTRLTFDMPTTRTWAESSEFFKLEVLRSQAEGNKGMVEFRAHFRLKDGSEKIHHEISKFRKQAGVWYFRDGKVLSEA